MKAFTLAPSRTRSGQGTQQLGVPSAHHHIVGFEHHPELLDHVRDVNSTHFFFPRRFSPAFPTSSS